MKTQKEAIEQVCMAIAGWMKKRGHCKLLQDENGFNRADNVINYWIKNLEEYVKKCQ